MLCKPVGLISLGVKDMRTSLALLEDATKEGAWKQNVYFHLFGYNGLLLLKGKFISIIFLLISENGDGGRQQRSFMWLTLLLFALLCAVFNAFVAMAHVCVCNSCSANCCSQIYWTSNMMVRKLSYPLFCAAVKLKA